MRYDDEDEDEGPQPDATLEQGVPLPVRLQGNFPAELSSTPLVDIDTFYNNQKVSHTVNFINLILDPKPRRKFSEILRDNKYLIREDFTTFF